MSLFATTQATGKCQNIEAKLKLFKKGMSKEKNVNRERQEKTGEHRGERKVLTLNLLAPTTVGARINP